MADPYKSNAEFLREEYLDPYLKYDPDAGIFESGLRAIGDATFGAGFDAFALGNDILRGGYLSPSDKPSFFNDPNHYRGDLGFNDFLDALAIAPAGYLAKGLKGAKFGLPKKTVAGAAAAVPAAGITKKALNDPEFHEPGSIGAFFEPEKVRPVEDPAQAQGQGQGQGVNGFNEPMTQEEMQKMAIAENTKRFQQMAGIAGDDDPLLTEKMNIVQLEALERETPGGLNFTDKTRLIDARRAVRDAEKEKDRLAYEERRKNRTSSPRYIPPRASKPASQEVMVFPQDGSGPVKADNMREARQKAKEMGLIDNSISQAKAEQLANKFDIPVKSFDRNIAYDLNVHGLTPETARQQRGINPITGELSASRQARFDEREAEKKKAFDLQEQKNKEDFNKFGLAELYNKRMAEQIKRENPFDTPDQLLAKRIQRQSQG
jgi:hypothetical protein